MRTIHKTISLEPMTSRLPSVVPAYIPGTNSAITFDDAALRDRDYAYISNYGLIPCNINIPSEYNVCYANGITNGNGASGCTVISFERLSNWYHKFKEYYNLLNHYGHCSTVYSSATQYYDNEVKRWPEDLYYGTDRGTYEDLDRDISYMGGVVSSTTRNETLCQTSGISESFDIGFYEWICENVIPTYKIPRDLQDYWKMDTLYYPDVIKWIGWFENRNQYSAYTTEESCSASSDCCDCVEYVKRGGYDEYSAMTTWYDDIQDNIKALSANTSGCYAPHIISPIELQNSIEDLGEFTIFCEEYQDKVDYRVADGYVATANTKSGTTVIKDGELMRLKDGKLGYTFDDVYMESKFDEDAWEVEEYSHSIAEISGYTTSKLKSLHRTNYLTDDIGNTIEGIYTFFSGDTNSQPPEGEVLEPIYQVGTIANIVRVGDTNLFIGDEILSMEFYYKDYNDEIISGTSFTAETPTSSNTETALDAIESATSAVTSSANTKLYQDDIFCNVEYEVGRIYEMSSSGSLETVSSGVSYTEEVQFVKERTEYYLKKKDNKAVPSDVEKPDVHSVSYPIYIYRLKQKSNDIDNNAYDTPYYDNLAEFKALIERKYDPDYEVSGDTKSPIIREEYRLGIAALENVRGNIYIDRGINSAFEKHLKIGEVTSMESLLQYGNGYFKIMDN